MLRSLRVRLLLAVGTVVVLAVAAVGFVTSWGTRMEFHQFMELEAERRMDLPGVDLEGAARELEAHRSGGESWRGAGDVLERWGRGATLVLLSPDGTLVASGGDLRGLGSLERLPDGGLRMTRVQGEGRSRTEEVIAVRGPWVALRDEDGRRMGFLHVMPELEPAEERAASGSVFLQSVNRWMLLGAVAAGLLALLATATVARRVLGPVEQLTIAARRMGEGDRGQRVATESRDEVGELARAFNQMADSLERQEHLRRQLVSDVAHDLRTPLTNVRGQLEAVQDGLLEPSAEVLRSLHEEVMFLSQLVQDLQDLSLAEAGALRLEIRPMAAGEEIARVVQALSPSGIADGPDVEMHLPQLPEARADPARFRQIVQNLLGNALTHTGAGGRILVEARTGDGEIQVTVQDDGPGIAPEHLPHVFERFYRADPSRGRSTGGAGLGLAIVKQLVTAQNGRVWVDSQVGGGTTFGFTVPVA